MAKLKKNTIAAIINSGIFSEIDIHFAGFILRFSVDQDPDIFLAAALVSRATANGDICLNLDSMSETVLLAEQAGCDPILCPPAMKWRRKLKAHTAVDEPGGRCPLILDYHNRLYLYRYWEYEKKLSSSIRDRAAGALADFNPGKVKACLDRLFPVIDEDVDWQKVAAVIALLKRFSVITGGPGSGKTYAIAGILALILECTGRNKLNICLTAPTGKAAARLSEAIKQAKEHLNCDDDIKNAIPDEVYTIHRLLKPIAGTPYFRQNIDNPLPADFVVIDEASMVDLALMSKLMQAVAPDARLLLVGDKDQLASVEAGSILGDICDRQVIHGFSKDFLKKIEELTGTKLRDSVQLSKAGSGLQDCVTILQKSYRFSARSGIGGLSRAVNHGDAETSLALLKNHSETSMTWYEVHSNGSLSRQFARIIIDGYRKYLTIKDPVLAMREFSRFKILCALKIGPFGVTTINNLAEQVLSREDLIRRDRAGTNPWYKGRPVLITRNDYNLGLFNGDIGITLPDPNTSGHELYVYFPGTSGDFKRFSPHRLSEHETVYAMTVHKSQGSEFDHIILILPDKDYPLLTRELIYTGLTRARQKVSIWGTESVFKTAIVRKIERTSGLRDALWT